MQQWSYPYPIHKVRVMGNIDIAYVDEGKASSKPSLLMVHGLGSNLKAFWKNIAHLSPHYRCIAVDLPGYGHSSQGDYSFGMHFFVEALHAFIQALNLGPTVVMGHSMGAQIALHLAYKHPQEVHKLVLLAPAGFEVFKPEEQAWFDRVYAVSIMEQVPVSQIIQNFHLNFFRFPDDASFMIQDRLFMRQHQEDYRYFCRMAGQCVRAMLREPVYELLPLIAQPALVVFGRDDMLIPNRWLHPGLTTSQVAQRGTLRLARAELCMLGACGHFPQWEQADAFHEELRSFL